VLTAVIAVAVALALAGTPAGWDPPPEPPPDPIPIPTPEPPAPPPVPEPAPEPKPATAVQPPSDPAVGPAAASYPPALRRRYAAADDNGDGRLSWDELSVFQSRLVQDIPYASNSRALSPEAFLAAGSGDCEDFALFTCGLLAYWGIECYLGSLAPKSGGTGHAVALVPVTYVPDGFSFFRIEGARSASGELIPGGTYVPIDYEYVGGLSDAAGKGWVLRWIRVPEEVYGLAM
jgi:transglutaminase-like putative cysteine protease